MLEQVTDSYLAAKGTGLVLIESDLQASCVTRDRDDSGRRKLWRLLTEKILIRLELVASLLLWTLLGTVGKGINASSCTSNDQ